MNVLKTAYHLMKFLLLGETGQKLKRNKQKTNILFFLTVYKCLSAMAFISDWIYLGIKTFYCTVVSVNETGSSVVQKMLEHLLVIKTTKQVLT